MAYRTLSDQVIQATLKAGEFPDEVTQAAEKVVVILTQDWCHDWQAMQLFVGEFTSQAAIFVLEYNLHPDFEAILAFKEDHWGNREIPYLRYYHQGRFIVATNQLPRATFAALLTKTEPFTLR